MRNLNLEEDKPSLIIFYNPYMLTGGALKMGDKFRTKEDHVRAIKNFLMEISTDYIVYHTNLGRYIIMCRQKPMCMFRMTISYRKKSDSCEISSIDPSHTCIATITLQDHRKLSSQIIYQEILPLISKDPSLNMSARISRIISRFNYTPYYKKTWIARTKVVERVYDNWEDSYKELPKYLVALKYYAPGIVSILETLLTFIPRKKLC